MAQVQSLHIKGILTNQPYLCNTCKVVVFYWTLLKPETLAWGFKKIIRSIQLNTETCFIALNINYKLSFCHCKASSGPDNGRSSDHESMICVLRLESYTKSSLCILERTWAHISLSIKDSLNGLGHCILKEFSFLRFWMRAWDSPSLVQSLFAREYEDVPNGRSLRFYRWEILKSLDVALFVDHTLNPSHPITKLLCGIISQFQPIQLSNRLHNKTYPSVIIGF